MFICYLLAWDCPNSIEYVVESDWFPESVCTVTVENGVKVKRLAARERDPFTSHEACDAYERGELRLEKGRHFACLSRDVRFCSASAIEAILGLAQTIESENKSNFENINLIEMNIINSIEDRNLTGKEIAKRAGYPYNSHLRGVLAALKRRGILVNSGQGYRRAP
jgi:hypothetical protein